jgi:O-antigen/teichoic acid export membrane protein
MPQYNKLTQAILGTDPNSLRARLIKGATGSMMLRATSILLGLVSSVLLARFVGAHGYGIYTYALAWVNLLMIISTFGTQNLLIRNIAVYREHDDWSKFHGLIRWTNLLAVSFSIIISIILVGISYSLYLTSGSEKALGLIVAAFLLPVLTLSTLRQSALQGLHCVVAGQLPEFLVRPIALIAFITASYLIFGNKFTGTVALANNLAAAIIAFITGTYLLHKNLPGIVRSTAPKYMGRVWIKSALPFLLISGLQAANGQIAILILGTTSEPATVGIFSVALRIAGLLSFFLLSANAILAPNIASLYSKGENIKLQALTTKSARIILLLSLPVAIVLITLGKHILSIFGDEFTTGYELLVILSIGQLFNAAMGSVGLLLTMTNHEKDALWGIVIGFIINIVLNLVLIPLYGALGAALAVMIYAFIWNIIFGIFVYKRTGIIPSIVYRTVK